MSARQPPAGPRCLRGVGSLPLVLIWLAGLGLLLLMSQQGLVQEQRNTAQQVRLLQAEAAADAGSAWALAMLELGTAAGVDCQPLGSGGAAATWSARAKALGAGSFLQAACRLDGGGWVCHCPDTGPPALGATPTGAPDQPAFAVRLGASAPNAAGLPVWPLEVTGCPQPASGCGGTDLPEARSRQHLKLAGGAGWRLAPSAVVTALGALSVGTGVVVAQGDPRSGGWTLRAGGLLNLSTAARLLGPPGRPPPDTALAPDTTLDANRPDATFWLTHAGLDEAGTRASLPWTVLDCRAGCSPSALTDAAGSGARLLWWRGDLALPAGQILGDPVAPVLLVVEGHLGGADGASLTGLVIARSVAWHANRPSRLQGALVGLQDVALSGPLDLVGDPPLLDRLTRSAGGWVALPGSWQDFDHRVP